MKVVMTKAEYLQLREVIINIDNDNVIKEFNRICTNNNPNIKTSATSETFTLNVSEDLSTEIGKVLISHSKGLGKNLNIRLTSLPALINQVKKLFNDIGATIKKTKH